METNHIKQIIEQLLKTLPVKIEEVVVVQEITKVPVFVIKTPDAPLVIGPNGAHFQALFHLIKKIVSIKAEKQGVPEPSFFIDVNDYRANLARSLATKASILAERAISFCSDVEMEPMSSYERLIVHECLVGKPNIKTESVGQGKGRRVVIKYVKGSLEQITDSDF